MQNEDGVEYTTVFYQSDAKDFQWRLTVNTFRGVQYLNIRKYFLTFEEDYQPTKEGMTIPLELDSTYKLAMGLAHILSNAEESDLNRIMSELRTDTDISG